MCKPSKRSGLANNLEPNGIKRPFRINISIGVEKRNVGVAGLLDTLGTETAFKTEYLDDAKVILQKYLPELLRFLAESSKEKAGLAEFVKLNLLYLCIDELIAAFHLARHFFNNQAFSHIRSVVENLDKVELFLQQPKWAELWANDDPEQEKTKRREFMPSSVRKKLGKESYDPIYGMFSELGPHGTFSGVGWRTALDIQESTWDQFVYNIWIGGSPHDTKSSFTTSNVLYAFLAVLEKVVKTYFPTDEKCLSIYQEAQREIVSYTKKHFVNQAVRNGQDPQDIIAKFDESFPEYKGE